MQAAVMPAGVKQPLLPEAGKSAFCAKCLDASFTLKLRMQCFTAHAACAQPKGIVIVGRAVLVGRTREAFHQPSGRVRASVVRGDSQLPACLKTSRAAQDNEVCTRCGLSPPPLPFLKSGYTSLLVG